jgi:hypothetical protein
MRAAWRPPHLLLGVHSAVQQPLHLLSVTAVEIGCSRRLGGRPMRSGPKPALAGAMLRKAVMAIWCVCFCGMQWRAMCDIPFGTLYGLFAR